MSPVLNIIVSVVPLTTDLVVGIFGTITCSGYACIADLLQYTVYAVMMPFFGMGGAQISKSRFGEPDRDASEMFSGGDGTAER